MKKHILAVIFAVLVVIPLFVSAFSDLPKDHKYYPSLMHLKDEGIVDGYKDGTVKPDDKINRAELVKILIVGLGHKTDSSIDRNCFPDVNEEWFALYICYAQRNGWINGYPDGLFYPEKKINRAEALKIIINAFQLVVSPPEEDPFVDVDKNIWFSSFVNFAKTKNLIPESGELFEPNKLRTRGEIAETISRIIKTREINEDKFEDWPTEWVGAEVQTLQLINSLRAANGKPPLVLNRFLTKTAREHSKDMAENIKELSHEGSNKSTAADRISKSGAKDIYASAENIGSGTYGDGRSIFDVSKDVHVNIFMEEPNKGFNHKTTMLSQSFPFSEVGIGIFAKDNKMYFTADFISIKEK